MSDPLAHHPPLLSAERREAFWRRSGWRPDLAARERECIEQRWDDESIDMAEIFGF